MRQRETERRGGFIVQMCLNAENSKKKKNEAWRTMVINTDRIW